jgi:hypothetical protein
MVAAGAHTPREKLFRPFFSWTIQWSPAAFTRLVRAASPGGSSAQPSGAVRTVPSAARTVLGVGPGVKVTADLPRFQQSDEQAHGDGDDTARSAADHPGEGEAGQRRAVEDQAQRGLLRVRVLRAAVSIGITRIRHAYL